MAFIAAEHTAQLNTAQADEVFSSAEEHELLFQDIPIQSLDGSQAHPAIDVLSCTTTMEVGIDIGALSGVALRNMPPARANYQQRAGRAGRRGNAVATVVAFGSVDSHDEHFFSSPDQMIRGPVNDPLLSLDNVEIARRHVTAYLLQRYHQERLPEIQPEEQPQLFEVLGSVAGFLSPAAPLNRVDLEAWLKSNETQLRTEMDSWIPDEIPPGDRQQLLDTLVSRTLEVLDDALEADDPAAGIGATATAAQATPTAAGDPNESGETASEPEDADRSVVEAEPESDDPGSDPTAQAAKTNLLDRLLYKGVLPRYAFPTDVASFYVFNRDKSTRFRAAFRYTPSQGLAAALSQYAPGREIWINRQMWFSGAIYSPFTRERFLAWGRRRLYYECSVCGYALTMPREAGTRGEQLDCEACGSGATLGPARYWLRPPGFAHPAEQQPVTSTEDLPEKSYATRAKLSAPTPQAGGLWTPVCDRIRLHPVRERLLVTNRGPRELGYHYCTDCGRIEAAATHERVTQTTHPKPFPDEKEPNCNGNRTSTHLMLGTDFITDILLFSLRVDAPLSLRSDLLATQVSLRTVCEAIVKAATAVLGLEPGELEADFRPALTPEGRAGTEAEIYLYDTLAGGAGFSRRAGAQGLVVLKAALTILEECPADCDNSCYRCLRGFGNRLEHSLLDRHLGASLLRYLLEDAPLTLPDSRWASSYALLAADLSRSTRDDRLRVESNVNINVPG